MAGSCVIKNISLAVIRSEFQSSIKKMVGDKKEEAKNM